MRRLWGFILLFAVAAPPALRADNGGQSRYDCLFLEAMMARGQGKDAAAFELLRHCVDINPDAAEAYFYLAQYYSVLRDKDNALSCIKKAAELNPQNSTYQETLVQAYIGNGQTNEAISALEKLVKADPGRDDALEMLAQLYLQKKDYTSAIRTFDRLETLEGRTERLSFAKSSVYTMLGDKKAAVAEVRKLAEQNPNDPNYECAYGETLMRNGETDSALAVYNNVLRTDPDNNSALLLLRTYYKGEKDTARADSITMAVLLNRNTDKETRVSLLRQEIGETEQNGGDSTKILRFFKRLTALPAQDGDLLYMYAAYMDLKKMPEDSICAALERVLLVAPDNAAARLRLVNYAWKTGNLDRVIGLCRSARQYNPDEMAFYYFQGMAYYRSNDEDKALDAFQNGISVITDQSNPDFVSDFYAVMGDILFSKGRTREAFNAYDSCLQWKDDNISCLNNYAYYLSLRGENLDKAEQMSRRTVEREPFNATYLDTYAWIVFLQQRYGEARVYIDRALKNDTDSNAVITEHAGDIYAMSGDTERAVQLWQEAAKKDPGNKLLARKIRKKKYIKGGN